MSLKTFFAYLERILGLQLQNQGAAVMQLQILNRIDTNMADQARSGLAIIALLQAQDKKLQAQDEKLDAILNSFGAPSDTLPDDQAALDEKEKELRAIVGGIASDLDSQK